MADLNIATPAAPDVGPGDGGSEAASLRDDIDAAFAQVESDEPAPPPAGDRARDAAGRFAAQQAEEAARKAPGATHAAPPGVTSPAPRPGLQQAPGMAEGEPAPELRAPAQWKPEAREKWAGVDPLIKNEVTRREREFQSHLQQASGLRDFVQAFESTVRPYEMFIRAENSSPLQAVESLMQTAAELRVGTPESKAVLVSNLVAQYGIDLRTLDRALAQRFGVAQPAGPNGQLQYPQQQQAFQDPRLDQMLMYQQAQAQQQAETQQAEILSHTQSFADSHEFFDDVRHDMADMIEMQARRGQIMTVQAAYDKACQMSPEISKILGSRQASQSPQGLTKAALRARRAASSVKGESSPHGVTTPAGDSLRASVEAAFETAGERSSRL